MTFPPLITKLNTFYGAYAPEFDVCSYGACRDEAVNNLAEELRGRAGEPVRHSPPQADDGGGRGAGHAR